MLSEIFSKFGDFTGGLITGLITCTGGIYFWIKYVIKRKVEKAPVREEIKLANDFMDLIGKLTDSGIEPDEVANLIPSIKRKKHTNLMKILSLKTAILPDDSSTQKNEGEFEMSQLEMNEEVAEELDSEKKKLEEAIKLLKGILSDEENILFDKAQDLWRAFTHAQSRLDGFFFEGGTIRPFVVSNSLLSLTRQRKEAILEDLEFRKNL